MRRRPSGLWNVINRLPCDEDFTVRAKISASSVEWLCLNSCNC